MAQCSRFSFHTCCTAASLFAATGYITPALPGLEKPLIYIINDAKCCFMAYKTRIPADCCIEWTTLIAH